MKANKELLRTEFAKAWESPSMIDFCTNKVATMAILPDGSIVTVDKESIKKDFCFGESGYDYDDAQNMAAYARKSEEYFKEENMKSFKSQIKNLTETLELIEGRGGNSWGDCFLVLHPRRENNIVYLQFYRVSEIIDAYGGSAYLNELPGKAIKIHGVEGKIATKEEIELILEAVKEAAEAHEKKVNTYLKKYGTSKVHSWTYWRDA